MTTGLTISPRIFLCIFLFVLCCGSDDREKPESKSEAPDLIYGADLSYVNQIVDKGGVYRVDNNPKDPYLIFAEKGTDLARFRLWHNPKWTKEVYGTAGTQLYNDPGDVERSISSAKKAGMKVLLDFHYSDEWADPGKQFIPEAWKQIRSIDVLADSVYNYTKKILQHLQSKDLQPDFVQVGNETNCGMFFSEAPEGFPACNVCNGAWSNMTSNGLGSFDIIGFSYYPIWHTTVPLEQISTVISETRTKFGKDVMILETAYPWTLDGKDSYNNQFGNQQPVSGFPFTRQGQYDFMKKLAEEVANGKGLGIIYWEPAWISSGMKDLWGTGSSWENCAFFDFEGNASKVFDYMKQE